jgi:hypothetical protein
MDAAQNPIILDDLEVCAPIKERFLARATARAFSCVHRDIAKQEHISD